MPNQLRAHGNAKAVGIGATQPNPDARAAQMHLRAQLTAEMYRPHPSPISMQQEPAMTLPAGERSPAMPSPEVWKTVASKAPVIVPKHQTSQPIVSQVWKTQTIQPNPATVATARPVSSKPYQPVPISHDVGKAEQAEAIYAKIIPKHNAGAGQNNNTENNNQNGKPVDILRSGITSPRNPLGAQVIYIDEHGMVWVQGAAQDGGWARGSYTVDPNKPFVLHSHTGTTKSQQMYFAMMKELQDAKNRMRDRENRRPIYNFQNEYKKKFGASSKKNYFYDRAQWWNANIGGQTGPGGQQAFRDRFDAAVNRLLADPNYTARVKAQLRSQGFKGIQTGVDNWIRHDTHFRLINDFTREHAAREKAKKKKNPAGRPKRGKGGGGHAGRDPHIEPHDPHQFGGLYGGRGLGTGSGKGGRFGNLVD